MPLYRWETHGLQHCETCRRLDGEVRSADEWLATIQPGFHAGCDCTLEPLDETTSASEGWLPLAGPSLTRFSISGAIAGASGGLHPRIEELIASLPYFGFGF